MDADERAELLAAYRAGHAAVADALAGATDSELDSCVEGDWTPRQIAHHMADSEMTSAIRVRRLLAETSPVITGYDEQEFARRLRYDDRPVEASLEAFRWARESTAQILDRLSEEEWRREGTHTEIGPYTVEGWLRIYARHGHDHADQIRKARGTS